MINMARRMPGDLAKSIVIFQLIHSLKFLNYGFIPFLLNEAHSCWIVSGENDLNAQVA